MLIPNPLIKYWSQKRIMLDNLMDWKKKSFDRRVEDAMKKHLQAQGGHKHGHSHGHNHGHSHGGHNHSLSHGHSHGSNKQEQEEKLKHEILSSYERQIHNMVLKYQISVTDSLERECCSVEI